jgi:hypothetical protein
MHSLSVVKDPSFADCCRMTGNPEGILFAVAILLQSSQFPALMPTSSLLSA